MDDAPEIVVFGNFSQGAPVAENNERNKVRLLVTNLEEMFQCQDVSDILTNRVVECMLGACVQVLVPPLAFEVACDFSRKVLAFKNVDS